LVRFSDFTHSFYNQCISIDKAFSQLDIGKQIEQKGYFIHQALINMAKEAISEADFENKKKNFLEIIHKEGYAFNPDAPINTIIAELNLIKDVTTSSAGTKLKKIAKVR